MSPTENLFPSENFLHPTTRAREVHTSTPGTEHCPSPVIAVAGLQSKNHPDKSGWFFVATVSCLRASDVGRCRTLLTFSDLEGDHIANLEFIESNAYEVLGVEEQILHFAIASNESKSTVCQGLDSSVHI